MTYLSLSTTKNDLLELLSPNLLNWLTSQEVEFPAELHSKIMQRPRLDIFKHLAFTTGQLEIASHVMIYCSTILMFRKLHGGPRLGFLHFLGELYHVEGLSIIKKTGCQ
eukprot:s3093_g2.t1